jgi:uroporphyrin-III C-methyltransferase
MAIGMSKVFLVGAGPGDPELLTVKAYRLLQKADVILHDDLVSAEILQLLRAEAVVVNVGKRCGSGRVSQEQIHALMIWFAASAQTVVRLKGGDPLLFGRAAEEMEALAAAQVDCEVVPGITAAVAAAAVAGISLTDRRSCSHVVFTTAQQCAGKKAQQCGGNNEDAREWRGMARADATLAVYMPGQDYASLARDLTSAGFSEHTPCLLISRIGAKDQRVHRSTLNRIADAAPLPAPALLLVGNTVTLGKTAKTAMTASGRRQAAVEESIADLAGFGQTAFYIAGPQD